MAAIEAQVHVEAEPAKVFEVFTDIPQAAQRIRAIERVEMLTPGATGPGTRWRETRTMYGKKATEEMWVTDFEPTQRYAVEAEAHGAKYRTVFSFVPDGSGTKVTMRFEGEPTTLGARILSAVMMPLMKNQMTKVLEQDLVDLKTACEQGTSGNTSTSAAT